VRAFGSPVRRGVTIYLGFDKGSQPTMPQCNCLPLSLVVALCAEKRLLCEKFHAPEVKVPAVEHFRRTISKEFNFLAASDEPFM
jgi:hypothetical protein